MSDSPQETPAAAPPQPEEMQPLSTLQKVWMTVAVIALVYLLLVAVGMIGDGFKWLSGGAEGAAQMFSIVKDPFMGVFMGAIATALVQSSSTVTSVIVGLCAGGLPVSVGIPMIMGANMGTTITNTIVSLGHIGNKTEFRRAYAAATVHDFFNLYSIAVFLPIEMLFKPLERLSSYCADILVGGDELAFEKYNFVKHATKPLQNALGPDGLAGHLPDTIGGVVLIIVGIGLIFFTVLRLGKLLRKLLIGQARELFNSAIGRGPIAGIASGTVATVLVQSSSTTTSLAVPLAGSGVLSLRQIYPFTLGTNIGTTITAVLAATTFGGTEAYFAFQIALAHFWFNVIGVAVFYAVPFLKTAPMKSATWLADLACKRRVYAFGYIVAVFFVIPGALYFLDELYHEIFDIPKEPLVIPDPAESESPSIDP